MRCGSPEFSVPAWRQGTSQSHQAETTGKDVPYTRDKRGSVTLQCREAYHARCKWMQACQQHAQNARSPCQLKTHVQKCRKAYSPILYVKHINMSRQGFLTTIVPLIRAMTPRRSTVLPAPTKKSVCASSSMSAIKWWVAAQRLRTGDSLKSCCRWPLGLGRSNGRAANSRQPMALRANAPVSAINAWSSPTTTHVPPCHAPYTSGSFV